MLRAILLLIALWLLTSVRASAAPVPYVHHQGETPAPQWVVQVAGKAAAFWSDRGVVGCTGIETFEVPISELGAWAEGAGGDGFQGCAIWVSTDLVDSVSWENFSQAGFRQACHAITHEVGHALGLNHTPTGVMSINPEPRTGVWNPWFCRVWARWAVTAIAAHDARFGQMAEG